MPRDIHETRMQVQTLASCAPVHSRIVSGLCNILKFLIQQLSTKLGKFMHT